MNTQKLKNLLNTKNIADAAFLLAALTYLGCHLLLLLLEKKLGFFEVLAVILYGGLGVMALSMISLIARGIFLYKNPSAQTVAQTVILAITAIPIGSVLLKSLGLL